MNKHQHDVRRQAINIANEWGDKENLSDEERLCLSSMLRRNEAFENLTCAKQDVDQVVAIAQQEDGESVAWLAGLASRWIDEAIHTLVGSYTEDVGMVVDLHNELEVPFGVAIDVYYGGFRNVGNIREVDLHEFVAETGMSPGAAECVLEAAADSQTDSQSTEVNHG